MSLDFATPAKEGSLTLPTWLWLPTLLQTLLAAGLCFVPLFDLLAYEYCFATTLLVAISTPFLGHGAANTTQPFGEALRRAMTWSVLHLLPALFLISANASRVRNCNYLQGLLFFALLPVSSALYGATLGAVVARALRVTRPFVRALGLLLFILAPLLWSLWLLYSQPPIFVYDHLWGYFAGSLYDETIKVDRTLWMFRLGTALRLGTLLGVVHLWRRRRRRHGVLTAAAAVGLVALSLTYDLAGGARFGFRVDRSDIEAALPVTIERQDLVIHLPQGLPRAQQEAVADDHAYRLAHLCDALQVHLTNPIHSYMYADAQQKAFLMGGRNTMITKPWLFEIHVHNPVAPHPVVPHELAHAVAATFGSRWLKLSARHEVFVNMGWVEGFAQAFTPDNDELDLHHWARALRVLNLAPDIRQVVGPAGFWTQSARRAYTVTGSFVRYLIDTHGAEPIKAAYATGDLEGAYHQSLDALVSGWETMIDKLPTSPREAHIAAERFASPSIFAKVCAHEISRLSDAADRADPVTAVALRQEICDHLGQAPTARLALAQAQLRAGDTDAFVRGAKDLLEAHGLNAVQEADLRLLENELALRQHHLDEAQVHVKAVLDMQISVAAERQAWARLWAMRLPQTVRLDAIAYLLGQLDPVAAVLAFEAASRDAPDDKTFPYLTGRQLHRVRAWEQAITYLDAARGHPFGPIEAERQRLLAECLWHLGKLDAASAAYAAYARLAPTSGEAAQARDWQRRIAWRQAQKRPL